MTAFFVVISTNLAATRLDGARRRLAELLDGHGIRLKAIRRQKTIVPAILRALKDRPRAPVAVIDEKTVNPAEAAWLRELLRQAGGLQGGVLPQVIYITRQATAAGTAVAQTHPLLRGSYVQRDDKGQWVNTVADRIIELLKTASRTSKVAAVPVTQDIPGIVGMSHCFREAIRILGDIFDTPCGLVTGEVGTGKMFAIRSLYQHRFGKVRMTVLPCGMFVKDYYIAYRRGGAVGDQKTFDKLDWHLKEADGSVLVLHHIERLPTALQDELATVLQEGAANPSNPSRICRVVKDNIEEYEVRIIATSTMPPEFLADSGHVLPELVRRLAKHHVRIPPLRERGPEDIRLLTRAILSMVAELERRAVPDIDEAALAVLVRTTWPNNISDLRRALEHACRECRRGIITRDDLPGWLDTSRKAKGPYTLDEITRQAQRVAVLNALDYTGQNVAKAAIRLGRDPKGLYHLMKSLGIKTKRLQADLIRRQMGC